ncbi:MULTISPECIES: phosphopantetheine-binding protein [unclassified Streptomyces]|uniref:phosphopantetheine-binding protein n=1 Tax=unclassified Streptomyces TaxID=2593676 RepID=UPI00332CDEE9
MSSVDTAVHSVLTAKFEVPQDLIRPEATLESLDLDSLALAELALALQEELAVEVQEHEATKSTTIAGLTAALAAKRTAAGVL